MFITKPSTPTDHQIVIDKLYSYLKDQPVTDDKYADVIENLIKLQKLKDASPSRISADAKIGLAANLAGILAIIGYERIHVITTKALGLVTKLR